MQEEAKKLYDTLKTEGLLKTHYGTKMTGNWDKDKKSFLKQYESNEKMFGLDALDLDEFEEDNEETFY